MICPNCHQIVRAGAAFCGSCGQALLLPAAGPAQPLVSGVTAGPIYPPAAALAAPPLNNGKAIAAFVFGMLGLVGWLIPLIGVILGMLALIFGTIAVHAPKRVFARIGIGLAVPVLALSIFFWVRTAEQVLTYGNAKPYSASQDASGPTQSISSPCYVTTIPDRLTLTKTAGSCSFSAVDASAGETYVVKVLQVPQLTAANLAEAAQQDAANVANAIPGSTLAGQQASSFASSPAYRVDLKASDGSAGRLDYVYNVTAQGNLTIVMHTQRSGQNIDLAAIESNWAWQ